MRSKINDVLCSGVVETGPREADWLLETAERRAGSGERRAIERIALELAARRASGEPLQYVLGSAVFRHLELSVGPGVLVPRPETEVLVERALDRLSEGGAAVDAGTGSGAIALAIKHERPSARVWAIDDSVDALRYARANRARWGLEVEILHGELLKPLPSALRGAVDLVVSNPPYVAESDRQLLGPDVIAHEPHHALFAGRDGLGVVTRLVGESREWLRPGGWLVCEIGHDQAARASDLLEGARYREVAVHRDLAGRDRIIEGRKAV
ncbi:MAG: peptide chain release factor N(5)-glutamine methyltransferase [Actinomycetota bacterium]